LKLTIAQEHGTIICMEVFIIAALTADGLIAKNSNHPALWTSKEDKQFFQEKTKEAGIMIMGAHTFATIGRSLPGRKTIVYTRNPQKIDSHLPNVRATNTPPKQLLEELKAQGHTKIAICGGSAIYTLFLQSGLVDKLYLTIEPTLFGRGMGLFTADLEVKLHLVSSRKLSDDVVLLEYDVV